MNPPPTWLVPSLTWPALRKALSIALVGGIIAGVYGMVHDAITFRIGPSYFEDFKFDQFRWADFGLPRPWFAVEIGFLASWWVGFGAAYFMGRYAGEHLGKELLLAVLGAVLRMLALAILAFAISHWAGIRSAENEFQHVAWIHNSSYTGAFFGLIWGLMSLRRRVRAKSRVPAP
jgi:hypothetical protein